MSLLSDLEEGQSAVVRRIDGGREFTQRMAEMGIASGTPLRVVRGGGPMVIEVRGHRLVIGHGMVGRIHVQPSGVPGTEP